MLLGLFCADSQSVFEGKSGRDDVAYNGEEYAVYVPHVFLNSEEERRRLQF